MRPSQCSLKKLINPIKPCCVWCCIWVVPPFLSRINSANFLQNCWAYNICVRRPRSTLWPDNPETVSSLGGNSFFFFFLFSVPGNKKTSNPTARLNGRKENIQACIYTVLLSMATGHKFMFATITKTHEHQFSFIR